MKRRALTIGLAVMLAILGTTGVLAYVNHANDRALAGQRAVTVLVAKSIIPAGTAMANAQAQGLLTTERLPAASVPANALAAVTPDVSALVTNAEVQPGQLVLRPMLVSRTLATNGLAVPPGMFAVAIQFCVPEAVAGNLQAGSQVAVFETTVTGSSSLSAQAACNGAHQLTAGEYASTRLVLPRVTVLSIGQGTGSASASTASTASTSTTSTTSSGNIDLITLAVSQADATQLIAISENGLPYLALVAAS